MDGAIDSRRLTHAESAALALQISGITSAALPLASGLRAMAEEVPSNRLRSALLQLAGRLDQGLSLDESILELGSRLPPDVRELVRAGLRARRLGEVLSQYVRDQHLATQLRRQTVASLSYPFLLFSVFVCVFLFMMIGIVPSFRAIYLDFHLELPSPTVALVRFSDLLREWWLWLVLLMAATGVLVFTLALVPLRRQRLLNMLPLAGRLWRYQRLAQFARLLAMMVESELPLPEALRLAGGGVRDSDIADAASQLATEVEAGLSLTESRTRRSRFPAGLAQSLQWGQSSQSLAESLRTAADMLEGQALISAEFVFRLAPPLTMILIVTVLGFVLTGLFAPLMTLIHELSS
jgi:general secretion pathway protein F